MERTTSFGEHLRHYRELAEQAGLTPNTIGALERGERRHLYPHTVQLLATALHLSDDQRTAFCRFH